jgi:hypothetical protein
MAIDRDDPTCLRVGAGVRREAIPVDPSTPSGSPDSASEAKANVVDPFVGDGRIGVAGKRCPASRALGR